MLSSIRRISTSNKRLSKPISYSNTLQLPKTAFGPKIPNKNATDPLINRSSQELYLWQQNYNKHSKGTFTLHDGPPYANGDLHLGHALNKIAKDVINRWQLLRHSKKIDYRPGWDCHGLPIEMKAVKNAGEMSAVDIRKKCRALATEMIDKQRQQFKEFAIMADFSDPYITMNHEYEISQLKVFQKLVENGLLSRQQKPVWWGTETETALAEAELEYQPNHISTAIYVKYPIIESPFGNDTKLLIWTSTPWTLPANKAICINKEFKYKLIVNKETAEKLIVAENLVESLIELNEAYTSTSHSISGENLLSFKYIDPITKDVRPILHGDHVTDLAGTGLVHTAPAHGGEDFLIGKKNGLTIESSVDSKGRYSNIPASYEHIKGMPIEKGVWKVIGGLQEKDMVFHLNKKFKHSYPYDWRSRKPVIQRATSQWFVNVEKIKKAATESLDNVQFYPPNGKNRLLAFVNNRSEWCISRQRVWGVPLPIVYDENDKPVLEIMDHIIKKLDEYGTDEWFVEEKDISRWLPDHLDGTKYTKGKDTMDVWFDSGTSWTTLTNEFTSDEPLADVYLEGSDQHRGWFQSSLLNKIIASGENGTNFKPIAPFRQIITHGFTLDSNNDKMSKSKGNVVSPVHVMRGGGKPLLPALGTDGLRLWMASSNYTSDVNVTTEVLNRVFENQKKIRITLKYLLGNLNDAWEEPESLQNLSPLDQYILSKLVKLQRNCEMYYEEHNFQRVVKELSNFIATELSASYFDISKDCLYTDSVNSDKRRSIQTVLKHILRTSIAILSPIQPILTQEVWNVLPSKFTRGVASPFQNNWQEFYLLSDANVNEYIELEFAKIWELKKGLNKLVEQYRKDHGTKSSLELSINLEPEPKSNMAELLAKHQQYLADYFIVSRVNLMDKPIAKATKINIENETVNIEIEKSINHKCPRCWKFVAPQENELCNPCNKVVKNL